PSRNATSAGDGVGLAEVPLGPIVLGAHRVSEVEVDPRVAGTGLNRGTWDHRMDPPAAATEVVAEGGDADAGGAPEASTEEVTTRMRAACPDDQEVQQDDASRDEPSLAHHRAPGLQARPALVA